LDIGTLSQISLFYYWLDDRDEPGAIHSARTGRLFQEILLSFCRADLSGGLSSECGVDPKKLIPIETLRKGTGQIANGEFGIEVDIRSGDEFENLGRDFNEMSRKLKEGREMLVQSAKMGAVGQMAAGVVHEIGQPLTSISGLIDIFGLGKPSDADKRRLDLMKKEMERLTTIVSRFKNFARVSEHTMKPLSLNEVVEATYALLEHQLQMKRVYCNLEKQGDLPRSWGTETACNRSSSISSSTPWTPLKAKKMRSHSHGSNLFAERKGLRGGERQRLRYSKGDSGKIFDPFFTTKGPERGTGLALPSFRQSFISTTRTSLLKVRSAKELNSRFLFRRPPDGFVF